MFDLTFAPPLNWIYLALVVLVPMIGIAEYKGWFQLEYSKFRPTHGGMSSRVGMFILYFVPIPVYLWLARGWLDHATTTQWLLSAAMIGHFAKRCLEVLFLHKYSGPIGVLTVVQITLIYSLASALGGYLFARAPALDALFAMLHLRRGGIRSVAGDDHTAFHLATIIRMFLIAAANHGHPPFAVAPILSRGLAVRIRRRWHAGVLSRAGFIAADHSDAAIVAVTRG